MLGIEPRAARAAWTVFLVALIIATAYAIRETLAVFMVALLFAYMLMPVVEFITRFTPARVSKNVALAIVYLVLVGLLVLLGFTLGSRIADEANNLANKLPELLKNRRWVDTLPLPAVLEPVRARIAQALQSQLDNGGKDILPYVKSLGGQIISGARYILYIVLVPILAFFFLKDGHDMREDIVHKLTVGKQRVMVEEILQDINQLLGQYIRALVFLSLSSFVGYSLFLSLTGASYFLLLAGIAGICEFVPVVGPAAAGVVVLMVTGLSGYEHLAPFLIFWLVFRLFQDYVLSPYLMGKGVEMNPMLVLFGVLAGEQIAGVAGMFFSIPVLATLRVIFVRLRRARRNQVEV
jgi:predicted PurR-regulated permease PerM